MVFQNTIRIFFLTFTLTIATANATASQDVKMSDLIAGMAASSTLDPFGFEERLQAMRPKMTSAQVQAIQECLQDLYELGKAGLYNPPPPICFNGQCTQGDNPLGELALWAASMSSAIEGTPWTKTPSGQVAAMMSQSITLACSMMPSFCDQMTQLTYTYFKPIAQRCD